MQASVSLDHHPHPRISAPAFTPASLGRLTPQRTTSLASPFPPDPDFTSLGCHSEGFTDSMLLELLPPFLRMSIRKVL